MKLPPDSMKRSVMAADVAERFLQSPGGLFDATMAHVWREQVLCAGHSVPADQAFRAEVRAWLAANTPRAPRPRDAAGQRAYDLAWQRRQHEGGWAGISWPREYGGPGWSVAQKFLFDNECALAGAPRIVPFGVNMLGVGLHSYGFMDQAFWALLGFSLSQLLLMVVAWAPARFWQGRPGGAA